MSDISKDKSKIFPKPIKDGKAAALQKDEELTPAQIVKELDKYIIGQKEAKKAVAIALRNRYRRKKLDDELRDEVAPKNIIMIGPTGVGKTEIARRLANLSNAPFIKVEATKYTEVGYVGRDVESMIRDLVSISINNEKKRRRKEVEKKARELAQEEILNYLFPQSKNSFNFKPQESQKNNDSKNEEKDGFGNISSTFSFPKEQVKEDIQRMETTRQKLKQKLLGGKLEDKMIEIEINSQSPNAIIELMPVNGMENMDMAFQNIMGGMFPGRKKKKHMKIKEARKYLIEQAAEKLIDMDKVLHRAVNNVENMGIIFLDEIDKIATRESTNGADVSRQGVQRDLLPLVEGSSVTTKHGIVKTDHILFIAAGAFHNSKPSDLLPELQGRFPIRVELDNLSKKDLKQILTLPKNALIKQYKALLATEGIELDFTEEAIDEISAITFDVNQKTENIGARRLHTIMEKLLEDISFQAPSTSKKQITITKEYINKTLNNIIEDKDLSRYIL